MCESSACGVVACAEFKDSSIPLGANEKLCGSANGSPENFDGQVADLLRNGRR